MGGEEGREEGSNKAMRRMDRRNKIGKKEMSEMEN